MRPKVLFVPRSENAKLGIAAAAYVAAESCPNTCPLKGNGCYAESGNTRLAWTRAERVGVSWDVFCRRLSALPRRYLFRYGVAGDLPHTDGAIDRDKALAMAKACKADGLLYTHHSPTAHNLAVLREVQATGFAVNVSANNPAHADILVETGLPVVTVLASKEQTRTPAGRKVVPCPAETHGVACDTCRLCLRPERPIIGFLAHGGQARKAADVANFWEPDNAG